MPYAWPVRMSDVSAQNRQGELFQPMRCKHHLFAQMTITTVSGLDSLLKWIYGETVQYWNNLKSQVGNCVAFIDKHVRMSNRTKNIYMTPLECHVIPWNTLLAQILFIPLPYQLLLGDGYITNTYGFIQSLQNNN